MLLLTICASISCFESNSESSSDKILMNLLTAIDKENIQQVQAHIDAGTNIDDQFIPDQKPGAGAGSLHLSVLKNNKTITKMLLKAGANIDIKAKNKDEAGPLHWAAFFGITDMVILLIESGAAINLVDANQFTPLDSAIFSELSNRSDKELSDTLNKIIAILKKNGGVTTGELN
tara:strand:+ start:41602 stop:42126 length:525 start_codon:yes stop_codon:yes gene_type:complete